MLAVVESSMHEYRARQVSNITWALARLGLPSGAAFLRDHMLAAAYPLLPWCVGGWRVAGGGWRVAGGEGVGGAGGVRRMKE